MKVLCLLAVLALLGSVNPALARKTLRRASSTAMAAAQTRVHVDPPLISSPAGFLGSTVVNSMRLLQEVAGPDNADITRRKTAQGALVAKESEAPVRRFVLQPARDALFLLYAPDTAGPGVLSQAFQAYFLGYNPSQASKDREGIPHIDVPRAPGPGTPRMSSPAR